MVRDQPSCSSPFQCGSCGRQFGRLDHLDRHVKTHTNRKPHSCDICGKRYARRDILKRHQECHATIRESPKRKSSTSLAQIRVSRACKACAASKVRCTDQKPCARCSSRQIECVSSTGESAVPGVDHDPSNATVVSYSDDRRKSSEISPLDEQPQHRVTSLLQSSSEASQHSSPALQQRTDDQEVISSTTCQTTKPHDSSRITGSLLPKFLRDLLVPGDPRLEDITASASSFINPHHLSDIDLAHNHDFDNWTSSIFDDLDSFSATGTAESITSRVSLQPTPNRYGNVTLAASAKAFKHSVWNWVPVSKDSQTSHQSAHLHLPHSESNVLVDKVQLPKHQRLDQETRDKIFSMLLMSCDELTIPKLTASFPSRGFLERSLWIFLQTHRQQWDSWIHGPAFNSHQVNPALLASMVAAGAVLVPVKAVRNFGFALQEILRTAIPALWEKDNRNTRDLQILQAYALNLEVGSWSGDRRKMEIAESLQQILITICRRSKQLHHSSYKTLQPKEHHSGPALEEMWNEWTKQESWKRFVYHVYVLAVQASMTRLSPPLISSFELSLPLPESEELWRAESAREWKLISLELAQQSAKEPLMSLSEILRVSLDTRVLLVVTKDLKHITMLLYGLWQLVFDLVQSHCLFQFAADGTGTHTLLLAERQQNLVQMLDNFSTVFSFDTSAKDGTFIPWIFQQIEGQLTQQYLLMSLHAPLQSIECLAGKYGDEEACQIYPILQEWSQKSQARRGLWHASQLLAISTLLLPLQMRDFHAVMVYHASLVLWAYGIITGPATWLQQQQGRQRQQEDRPVGFENDVAQAHTPQNLTIYKAPEISDSRKVFLYLTDAERSSELETWLLHGVGYPVIRISSPMFSSIPDSTGVASLHFKRPDITPLESEKSQNELETASIQAPESVMRLIAGMLLGRPVESQIEDMDDRSPLVRNICVLLQGLGAAAQAIM